MFVDLLNKNLYVTLDEGKSFVQLPVSFSPDKLVFHPADGKSILAYTYSDRTVSCFVFSSINVLRAVFTTTVLSVTSFAVCLQAWVMVCSCH